MANKHAGEEYKQFNNLLFLLEWKVYWPHDYCNKLHQKLSVNKDLNGMTTSYPSIEKICLKNSTILTSCWKKQLGQVKKIIFAPHHIIDDSEYSLSSFLSFSLFIKARRVCGN